MKYQMEDRSSNASGLMNQAQNPYAQDSAGYNAETPNQANNFTPNNYNVTVDQDIRASYAADRNQLHQVRSSRHIRSLIATIFLVGGIVTGICLYFLSPGTLSVGGLVGILVGSYIFYLMLACICNDLYSYLSNTEHGLQFQPEYNRIRALIGRFRFYAQCYHNEIRVHTNYTTDSNGNQQMNTYTTNEKVITHTATEYVTPALTDDISGQVDRIRAQRQIVFINFLVYHRFKTDQCRIRFDQLYSSFQAMNRRDQFQNYTCNYEIPGLVDKQAFYAKAPNCKFLQWYFIFGVLGLIWPYSLWIESKVDRFTVDLTKILTF